MRGKQTTKKFDQIKIVFPIKLMFLGSVMVTIGSETLFASRHILMAQGT